MTNKQEKYSLSDNMMATEDDAAELTRVNNEWCSKDNSFNVHSECPWGSEYDETQLKRLAECMSNEWWSTDPSSCSKKPTSEEVIEPTKLDIEPKYLEDAVRLLEVEAKKNKYVSNQQDIKEEKSMPLEAPQEPQALRYNEGKPQYSLLSLEALEPCVRVLKYGMDKYTVGDVSGRNNWKKGMPMTQILNSMLRHIGAMLEGEMIDPESGLPHVGHLQCNAMFLGNKNNTNDLEE